MVAVARTLGAPVALALGAGAGAVLVTQNGINVNLRVLVLKDPFLTALASFAVGWVAVILAAVVHRPRCDGASLRKAPWYAYTGGVLGPVYVVAANVASPRLGFASYQLLATLGQLVASLIADARGFLILPKRRPTPWRIAALCVLAGGAVLSIDPEFSDLTWYEGLGFGSLAFAAGTIFPVQACVNAVMAQHLKTALRGAVVSFTGGVLILGILAGISVAARGGLVPDGGASEWWLWFGGLCGAYIVSANCAAVPIVGTASYSTVFIAAQLAAALLFDEIGAFNFQPLAPTPRRAVGAVLSIGAAAAYTLGAPPRKWLCWCCDRRGPTRLAEPGAELKAGGEGPIL